MEVQTNLFAVLFPCVVFPKREHSCCFPERHVSLLYYNKRKKCPKRFQLLVPLQHPMRVNHWNLTQRVDKTHHGGRKRVIFYVIIDRVKSINNTLKDVDWVSLVGCLWGNFHFHCLETSPDPCYNLTYNKEWIRPLSDLSRAFQMYQILHTAQWSGTKSAEITLIPHPADFSFNVTKFILKQANNLYKFTKIGKVYPFL